MKSETIEQIAKDEWDKKFPSTQNNPTLMTIWEVWKDAFQVALSKYKWTDEDMYESWKEGDLTMTPGYGLTFNEWLQGYETFKQTGKY